jgi:hypothetical protein
MECPHAMCGELSGRRTFFRPQFNFPNFFFLLLFSSLQAISTNGSSFSPPRVLAFDQVATRISSLRPFLFRSTSHV